MLNRWASEHVVVVYIFIFKLGGGCLLYVSLNFRRVTTEVVVMGEWGYIIIIRSPKKVSVSFLCGCRCWPMTHYLSGTKKNVKLKRILIRLIPATLQMYYPPLPLVYLIQPKITTTKSRSPTYFRVGAIISSTCADATRGEQFQRKRHLHKFEQHPLDATDKRRYCS